MSPRLPTPAWSALLALTLGCSPLQAQQPPASSAAPTPAPAPVQVPNYDVANVLSAIKDLKTKQATSVGKEKGAVLASINNALADPAKAYEQAVTAVELQGGGGGTDGTKIGEWRKRNGDLLRNREFVNVLRLNLVYLSLTWQHSMGTKVKDLLTPLLDYCAQLDRLGDTVWSFEIAKYRLGDNLFTKYFQIGPYIAALPDWSDQLFSADNIREKVILPELRAEKSPRLLGYWNEEIQLEATRAGASGNVLVSNRFNTVRRPSLLWNRAEDEALLGQRNQAVADMLALLKANPGHPDFNQWAERLTALVSPPKGNVEVGPAIPLPNDPASPTAAPQ